MALAVSVYKGGRVLGTGSATGGSASVTSYTEGETFAGRNVTVVCTENGVHKGRSFNTRVMADADTLVLRDKVPWVE